jgi:hypothetical protein
LGAISKPTQDQKAPKSATPAAAAPKVLIAWSLVKASAGLTGERLSPSAPPWARTPMASAISATTPQTSAAPSTLAVSSMWKKPKAVTIARHAAV